MQREDLRAITIRPPSADREIDSVLHLVGRVTESVFSFLGPETSALADRGVRQTVVLIDDPAHRHLLPLFHETVRLVLTSGRSGMRERCRELLGAFVDAANARRPDATHLHGILPLAIGLYAARFRGVVVPMLFSPHDSRWIGALRAVGEPALRALRPFSKTLGASRRIVANSQAEARTLVEITSEDVDVIESPVSDAFFGATTVESSSPLLATSSLLRSDPVAAARVAQCSALLTGVVGQLQVTWMGDADVESAARLQAARVTRSKDRGNAARVQMLSSAWVFVAASQGPAFPRALTEAMALGLPCVAWSTAPHRDVLRHGETGFLCRTAEEAIGHILALFESPELRQRIGAAARVHARERFASGRFVASVASVYGTLSAR